MFKIITLFVTLCLSVTLHAQTFVSGISFLPGEKWWGAFVGKGSDMPYLQSVETFDLSKQGFNNQAVPLFVSNKGRYIWSDDAFQFKIDSFSLQLKSKHEEIKAVAAGQTLRDAFLTACRNHFPPSGKLPDPLFFSLPQYNTWIELMYNQNQNDILDYANKIIQYDFPKGVFMIDDNWQKYYGNFDFKPGKFPDPKGMIDQLHQMGFKIMLWICPFVSADSPEFRELAKKRYLLQKKGSEEPALINWWNGYSACYDLTNPEAFEYFVTTLKEVQQKYGVDGFKFDAGDAVFYDAEKIDSYKKEIQSTDHTMAWAKIGLSFPFNEYRAGWRMGGEALVQRLGDKDYSWEAIGLLIPDMIAAGLLGYAYTCPDMIGGGQFSSFLGIDPATFDQNLIIRSTQIHALMPMMQFSVAPWRILNEENLAICRKMAYLHVQMGDYILECAKQASQTGEPIVRHLEYMFPDQGFANCKDQFMIGEKFMVAPVIHPGNQRTVILPEGKWRDELGKVYTGGKKITVEAAINRLPYFERIH
ncbi:alpha-glucosidase [termite gut metagenome]|uniref:Alpha-glucosidase n=1 Tax=termite gut metagenome TaxID=433724 RepID=A0A5J4T1P8_9ZZZZ